MTIIQRSDKMLTEKDLNIIQISIRFYMKTLENEESIEDVRHALNNFQKECCSRQYNEHGTEIFRSKE